LRAKIDIISESSKEINKNMQQGSSEDCFVERKTGFGCRGTSIAGKAFVERGCDEVGLCERPT